jgi:hypothetical protein
MTRLGHEALVYTPKEWKLEEATKTPQCAEAVLILVLEPKGRFKVVKDEVLGDRVPRVVGDKVALALLAGAQEMVS